MLLSLEEVKPYLRLELDYTEEDLYLELLIQNAELYISDGARDVSTMGENSLKKAKLLGLVLISDWYENREYTKTMGNKTSDTSDKVSHTIKSLLMQLRLRGDD